jgi:hypothetical protein
MNWIIECEYSPGSPSIKPVRTEEAKLDDFILLLALVKINADAAAACS